jgi:hypothetical protein
MKHTAVIGSNRKDGKVKTYYESFLFIVGFRGGMADLECADLFVFASTHDRGCSYVSILIDQVFKYPKAFFPLSDDFLNGSGLTFVLDCEDQCSHFLGALRSRGVFQ